MSGAEGERWGWVTAAIGAVASVASAIIAAVSGRRGAAPVEEKPPEDPFTAADRRVDEDRQHRREP